jgi:ADP-heptose:LPS heptosyltransferase
MKRWTVSILTFKGFPLVKACLQSVLDNSNLEALKIVLTDNGAGKACAEYFEEMRARFPGVIEVVHHETNQGFILPNNEAYRRCETPFFVCLNDDVEIKEKGWLEKLEQPLNHFPKAALAGPRGGCQSLTNNFDGRPMGAFEYLEGSVLMVKCETRKGEPLFPPYVKFAYGEDSALSLEMRQRGFTLHQIDLNFQHYRGQTARHIPEIKMIQAENHQALRRRFAHYLRVRKFEYPIVVRRWAARGDVLLITPILRQLYKENPLSKIYVETAFPETFAGNPYVTQAAGMIPRTFDARFINLDMSYEKRVGRHILDCYAEDADVTLTDRATEVYFSDQDRAQAAALLKEPGNWAALHLGPTTWPGKNWAIENWRIVSDELRERGFKVVLVGHNETTMVRCDRDLRGQTSFGTLAAVLDRCKLFIGLDSFPLHVAQAVGCPTIGLFGCTSPEYIMTPGSWWRAARGDPNLPETGSRHRLAHKTSIPTTGASMNSIGVSAVFDLVNELKWAVREELV